MFSQVLKVNESFAVLSDNGQALGQEQGFYLHDTQFLSKYCWQFPQFSLVGQEIELSHILHQSWSWFEMAAQRVGLWRKLTLTENGFTDTLIFENTGRFEEEFSFKLDLEESFLDMFQVRGWHPDLSKRSVCKTFEVSRIDYEYESSDGLLFQMNFHFSHPQTNHCF